jgi:putative membrane protein
MMKRVSYIAGAVACAMGVLLWSAAASAQTVQMQRDSGKMTQASQTTQTYVEKAVIGDMFEIQSSDVALKQATSPDVKAFAERMIKDHTTSSSALKAGIQSANIQVKIPESLDSAHQAKLADLRKTTRKDFDQAYMRQQIDAHKEALQLHRQYAESGDNPVLKKTAHNTMTIVEHHLQEAQNIAEGTPPQRPQSSSTR